MNRQQQAQLLAPISLIVCSAGSMDLLDAWGTSPADAYGWIALLAWLTPLLVLALVDRSRLALDAPNLWLAAAALLCALVGFAARLNVLEHLGLLLAIAGLVSWRRRNIIWMLSGVAWTPALGWLLLPALPAGGVLICRLLLAGAGAACVLMPRRDTPRHARSGSFGSLVSQGPLLAGVVGLVILASLWRFAPLEGAEARLVNLPIQGPGFRSWSVPLKEEERQRLGAGIAVRRLYQFEGRELLVSMVDGALNRHAIHDPMYCFAGSGHRVLRDTRLVIQGGTARSLRIGDGKTESSILYWFSDGAKRHASIARYWRDTMLRRVTFGASGPEPLLIVVQSDGPDEPERLIQACAPLFGV